ncbi:MAG: rRNA maturation RNase YbeY [Candidatus Gottesmanbacteria bacterium]|nr:rRNA maturation RNase YbeY [Candidatus Gottesmanbacteria bacterium]
MITILFQTETHYPVNRKKVRDALIASLEKKIKHPVEVSVAIIGDRKMKALNRTYRKIDASTDVLSFPFNDPAYTKGQGFVDAPDHVLRLGDIIISYPQAVATATEENKLVDEVIVSLALHGLDHLLGIHHEE